MFTGLVQEIGTVTQIAPVAAGVRWAIRAPKLAGALHRGDSICVAGACQTVETVDGDAFTGTSIPETLKKTTYGNWRVGSPVNLEPPLRPHDRLGGHFVSGHVDAVGIVTRAGESHSAYELAVDFDERNALWVIEQGSIAIDGVSLTVARRSKSSLTVALIPETLKQTTLGALTRGDHVNLEFDQLVKAAVQAVQAVTHMKRSAISEDTLASAGWL
jgi:riboflavin synthase